MAKSVASEAYVKPWVPFLYSISPITTTLALLDVALMTLKPTALGEGKHSPCPPNKKSLWKNPLVSNKRTEIDFSGVGLENLNRMKGKVANVLDSSVDSS